jgi:predicted metal-dependent phosphoesterase TrpH
MYPRALVDKAIAEKLDIVAVCDHNASESVEFVIRYAVGKPITILPGMEITSSEEVPLLALFDKTNVLMKL